MTMPTTPYTRSLTRTARYRQRALERVCVVAPACLLFFKTHAATACSFSETHSSVSRFLRCREKSGGAQSAIFRKVCDDVPAKQFDQLAGGHCHNIVPALGLLQGLIGVQQHLCAERSLC